MTPEEVAERITRGVEEQYVHSLLEAVTANLDVLGDPDPQTIYRVRRIHDLLPDELARVYLGYQGQILDEATYLLSEAAYDAGTEQALQDYTGHTPGLMYNYYYQRLHDVTVQGCVEVLNRYNVDLYGNMADKWYEVSMTAISQAATYSKGKDQIIKQAVADMRGITDITYKSGAKYPIDAAIRRHIETQLNQNHQRLTELRAAEYGWDLFMCSAHSDCRPTHYDFQGRVFSMGEHIGEIIDGRKVWDYAELGVGNVAGIYGANCRHYLTPYVPGYSEPQEPPYDERTNEERYDLTQKQRARERNVRAAKVEVYAAEQTGDPAAIAQARMKLGKAQRSLRDFCAEHDLVRRYDLERAYGIGKQPRGLQGVTVKSSAGRRAYTKVKTRVSDASELKTPEGVAIRDSVKLQKAFKPETAAQLGIDVENAMLSGEKPRRNAAKVFEGAVQGNATYARSTRTKSAAYNTGSRNVSVAKTKDISPRTIVHETVHLADHQNTLSYTNPLGATISAGQDRFNSAVFTTGSGYIKTHLRNDWAAIEQAATTARLGTRGYLEGKIKDAGLDPKLYESTGFVSDMIDAASNGGVYFSAAHTMQDPDYWKRHGGDFIGTECLADYAGSAICNPVEYRLMRDLFPETTATLDSLLEVMANG